MREELTCSICGARLTEETAHEFDGQIMCEDCFDEQTTVCECCGERIWRDNAESDGNITICYRCYENSYYYCHECGRLIHNDDVHYEEDSDYAYCESCFEKLQEKAIKSYNYKPEPIFYGSGNLFYGVELEIDKGGEYDSNAEILLNIANHNGEHMYCKHDGSIDDGFEMVTHPMSLDYHMSGINWLKIFNKAVEMGYRSHNTTTCGLHIHVNRSAFGKKHDEQEIVIARIVHFVEKHWWEIVKFSRRTELNLNRWAARYATISSEVQDTYKKAKDKRLGRYVAVNLENYATIEFRLFRGTLRYKTFIAALQLVDEICRLAIMLDDKSFESMSWSDFALNISKKNKPELIEYLKSKRLYVNDEIVETEEM
ncbi:MAG: amidoligase family protein [Clostridia bacterium]